jgi:hypothetical protein
MGRELSFRYKTRRIDFPSEDTSPNSIYYFKDGVLLQTRVDGYAVGVLPDGQEEWCGVFALDYRSPAAATQVVELSESDFFCVVASGRGYVLSARDPKRVRPIPSFPITQASCCSDRAVAAFADFTRITIVDRAGLMWTSPSLSWDGIRIIDVSSTTVQGFAWDSPGENEVPFTLNLVDRTLRGGAAPPSSSQ